MARRPLPIGTYGEIKATQLGPKRWEARARFRLADGSYARPRRAGTGKQDAVSKLKEHMLTLLEEVRGENVDPDSRMAHVAKLWMADVDLAVKGGTLSPATGTKYKGWVTNWVLPRIKDLTARELEKSVMTCEKAIKTVEQETSKANAKNVKAAFGQLCGWAVRNGAMRTNPVRSTDKVGTDRKKVQSLNLNQRRELFVKLEKFAAAKQTSASGRSLGKNGRVWADLPDRFRAKFDTGIRVGEVIALTGDSIDTQNRTVRIDHHIVCEVGKGTVHIPGRKNNRPNLTLKYPERSAEMWRRLKLRSGGGPLFPTSTGGWINPSSAVTQETEALKACGFGWVTGHVVRKTVATFLREKGLSVEKIAAQLGDSVKMVQMHYLEEVTNLEQAEALEGMFDDVEVG